MFNQGGDFSDNGVFYYVVDDSVNENSAYSGIHVFGATGTNSYGEILRSPSDTTFIHLGYDPSIHMDLQALDLALGLFWRSDRVDSRKFEIEGIDVYRDAKGRTSILFQAINNSLGDDPAYLFHVSVNEPPSH